MYLCQHINIQTYQACIFINPPSGPAFSSCTAADHILLLGVPVEPSPRPMDVKIGIGTLKPFYCLYANMYDHLVPYYKDYPMDYRFRGWNNLDGGFRTPIHLSIVLELNQFQQIYCLLINIFLFLELLDSKIHLTSSQISLSKPTHWPGSANCVQQMFTISSPQISWFRYQSSVMMIFSLSETKLLGIRRILPYF